MEEELKYLNDRLQVVEQSIERKIGYSDFDEYLDDQLEEQRILNNIIERLNNLLNN